MVIKKNFRIVLLVMLAIVLFPATFTYAEDCCSCGCCCVLTQGYWKNHPGDWPVEGLTLGGDYYSKSDLIGILKQPVKGNGLISLAHQLIAAKLNYEECGQTVCWLLGAFSNADSLIASRGGLIDGYAHPKVTSYWVTYFSDFNEGRVSGWPSCDDDGEDMAEPMSAPTAPSVFSFSVFR